MKMLRCAAYTRKSTEDGLEQEFNSLDAQREACEAYILSQRHEGWSLVPDRYDDGGFSGGSMLRPGLKAFANGHQLALQLREIGKVEIALRSLVAAITLRAERMEIELKPDALGIAPDANWLWTLPLPTRKPFREARLRIDTGLGASRESNELLSLIAEAMAARRLVLASPELSLAQVAKREGRCRTQLTKLLRISWLSPRIVEAIAEGAQPKGLTRWALLTCDMPIDWSVQERQFGFAA